MLEITRNVMLILMALLATMIGMAIHMGGNLESPTVVTHVYQTDGPRIFYLTDEVHKTTFTAVQHTCLMYLMSMSNRYQGLTYATAQHNGWTAEAIYIAHEREIMVVDLMTGLTCSFIRPDSKQPLKRF